MWYEYIIVLHIIPKLQGDVLNVDFQERWMRYITFYQCGGLASLRIWHLQILLCNKQKLLRNVQND